MTVLSAFDVDRLRREFDLLNYIRSKGCKLVQKGDAWRGECPKCGGGSKPVFAVWPGNGRAKCWRCTLGGDALDVVQELEQLDFRAALQFLGAAELPELTAEAREVLENEERAREAERARDAVKKRKAGRAVWDAAVPIDGTPAEAYLHGRGLAGPFPPTLRFHPSLPCSYTDAEGDHKRRLPALVAAVQGPAGDVLTVHRIYLDVHADGTATKAAGIPAEDVKKLHGPPGAGAVRLTPFAPLLLLGEGIETAQAVRNAAAELVARGAAAVWAGIAAGQLCRIEFAEDRRPARILVMADHDRWKWNPRLGLWVPPAGQSRAAEACARFRRMGIPAAWRAPVAPGDWLDVKLGAVPPGWSSTIPPMPAAPPAEEPSEQTAAKAAADPHQTRTPAHE